MAAERVRVREIDDDEGCRLLRIIRRGSGSVVTRRRGQIVLLSAQGMPVTKIAKVAFTSSDRVRDVILVLDNCSPHLTTKKDTRVGDWAAANNVEFAHTPTNSFWPNRIEDQFTALCYFALDGTDHASHKAQDSMIRRYIVVRNKNAADRRLKALMSRADAA